jgi:hypothetical protein
VMAGAVRAAMLGRGEEEGVCGVSG